MQVQGFEPLERIYQVVTVLGDEVVIVIVVRIRMVQHGVDFVGVSSVRDSVEVVLDLKRLVVGIPTVEVGYQIRIVHESSTEVLENVAPQVVLEMPVLQGLHLPDLVLIVMPTNVVTVIIRVMVVWVGRDSC